MSENYMEVQRAETFYRHATSIAQRLIKKHDVFNPFPADDGHGGSIIGWLRRLGTKGISQRAATMMLNEDLDEALGALRGRIWAVGHDSLGEARAAVLLYLALLPEIGSAKVLSWDAMWTALAEERWDDAANALLLTEWVAVMGSRSKQARAVVLQQVLRTGQQFNDADEARVGGMGA